MTVITADQNGNTSYTFGVDWSSMASAMSVPSMFFGTPPKPVNYKPKRVVFVE